jgi:hypothetical protein
MGKFGNKNIPKFMKSEDDMPIGEGTERIQELHEGHSAPEIISLGDADGGDFITIMIKTVEGEEVALDFKLDDDKEETEEDGVYKGTLSAEHNDVVYTINCEIEESGDGDFDIKIGEVTADTQLEDEPTEISESRVLRFGEFMNENMAMGSIQATTEGMNCSENAKLAIKSICEQLLCKEGEEYDMDEEADHTYEGYTQACMEYMKQCMMESLNR